MDRTKKTVVSIITEEEKDALIKVANLMGEIACEEDASDLYDKVDKDVSCLATEWNYIEEFLTNLADSSVIEEGD